MSENEDADVTLLQVRNRHSPEAGTPPRITDDLDANQYVGYFENGYGTICDTAEARNRRSRLGLDR